MARLVLPDSLLAIIRQSDRRSRFAQHIIRQFLIHRVVFDDQEMPASQQPRKHAAQHDSENERVEPAMMFRSVPGTIHITNLVYCLTLLAVSSAFQRGNPRTELVDGSLVTKHPQSFDEYLHIMRLVGSRALLELAKDLLGLFYQP